jgi:hypothetical protein
LVGGGGLRRFHGGAAVDFRRRVLRRNRHAGRQMVVGLERFQAKWRPVRVKKTRQIKNLELRFDSIETEKALVSGNSKCPAERTA